VVGLVGVEDFQEWMVEHIGTGCKTLQKSGNVDSKD
jgi:hypothetical protein